MLKILKLRQKLKAKNMELEEVRAKLKSYNERAEQLEQALEEAETEEDMKAVEAEIADLEKETDGDLQGEATRLEGEIADIEKDIAETEEKTRNTAQETTKPKKEEGGKVRTMQKALRYRDMTLQERVEFTERDEVKGFLTNLRAVLGTEKRAINGVDVTIPTMVVEMLRPEIVEASKLISKVFMKPVKGKARQEILGTIPEAVWTEMTAAVEELDLQFNLAEVDGYKVGGFVPIPNSYLEDSDVALMNEIMSVLGQAIGYGLDKAIVLGTGNKQPLGIITRLKQASKPSGYSDKMPEWKKLSDKNVVKASAGNLEGKKLFEEMIIAFGNCNSKYSQGQEKVFVMNNKTKAKMQAKALAFDSTGTIVANVNGQMPVLSGEIIELDFMGDDDILGGYFKPYLLAERAGAKMAASDQVRFIEDQTVFKGTARYDGVPVIADSWVLFNLNSSAVGG